MSSFVLSVVYCLSLSAAIYDMTWCIFSLLVFNLAITKQLVSGKQCCQLSRNMNFMTNNTV